MTKKKVIFMVFLLALFVFIYPFLSGFILKYQHTDDVNSFYSTQVSEDEKEKMEKEKKQYNKSLLEGAFNSNGDVQGLEFTSEKLMGGKTIKPLAVLYIPKIKEQILVYLGTSDYVMSKGAGILENTSLPGTPDSNSVISGHRGTHNATIFRHLDKLKNGDSFYVIEKTGALKYTVNDTQIVQPNDVNSVAVQRGRETVTLLTCTPYLINSERMLVIADRQPLTQWDKDQLRQAFHHEEPSYFIKFISQYSPDIISAFILVSLYIFILIVLIVVSLINRRKTNDDSYEDLEYYNW